MATKNESATAERELVITRTFNAPRALVFRAWTEPELLIRWWGPDGFTNTFHSIDVRPGGVWSYTMHGWGRDFPSRVTYRVVETPSRLVYLHDSGIDNDPEGFDVEVIFEEEGGKTIVTMRSIFHSPAVREKVIREYGAIEGAQQTMNKLEVFLATIQ